MTNEHIEGQFSHLLPGKEDRQLKELQLLRPTALRKGWSDEFRKLMKRRFAELVEFEPFEPEVRNCTFARPEYELILEESAIVDILRRRPDSYEFVDDHVIWYELDGTHPTDSDKFADIAWAADLLIDHKVWLHLWVYDVQSHQTIFFDCHDLAREASTVELMLGAGMIDAKDRFPVRLPATSRHPGMDITMLPASN